MEPNSPIYKAQTIGNIEPIEYMIPTQVHNLLLKAK